MKNVQTESKVIEFRVTGILHSQVSQEKDVTTF